VQLLLCLERVSVVTCESVEETEDVSGVATVVWLTVDVCGSDDGTSGVTSDDVAL